MSCFRHCKNILSKLPQHNHGFQNCARRTFVTQSWQKPLQSFRLLGAAFGGSVLLGFGYITYAETEPKKKLGPAMTHFSQVKSMELTPITDNQGANASIKTIVHSDVPGKQMQGGIFQLDPGPSFTHTYTYEAIVLVLDGQFSVTHLGGETLTLNPGDNMHVRAGTTLQYSTKAENSRFYFVIQPPQADDCGRIQAGLWANPAPTVKANLPSTKYDLPPLPEAAPFKSVATLGDILLSTVPGKELASGLYRILKGPSHDYVYDYEEFKYIVEGQLNLTDGTGQYVEAKAGDLMYFPDGTFVNFGTDDNGGLGFFVGQRKTI